MKLALFVFFLLQAIPLLAVEPHQVADGMEYRCVRCNDRVWAHVCVVDPKCIEMRVVHAKDMGIGREYLSHMVHRKHALAGVNGGFFYLIPGFKGVPKGVLKINGKIYSGSNEYIPAIGWKKDGSYALIESIKLAMSLKIHGQHFPVDRFCQPRFANSAVLYSGVFSPTTCTDNKGYEVIIKDRRVFAVRKHKGNSHINTHCLVYSTAKKDPRLAKIQPQDPVSIRISIKPRGYYSMSTWRNWQNCEYIMSGGLILIKDKQLISKYPNVVTALIWPKKALPRTAAGICPDGKWVFVVTEGRHRLRDGLTLPQLANLLLTLGCSDAINFDGGASSSLVIKSKVMNTPYRTVANGKKIIRCERPIADAILFFPRENHAKRKN